MSKYALVSSFLEEYAAFFEAILVTEKEKLQILMHGDLKEIEKSIAVQQANEKKIQNMEKKRTEMQKEAGFDGLTLKQIIENFEGVEKQNLENLFTRIDQALSDIKFFNKKGIEVVQTNLHLFGENSKKETVYSKDSITKK